MNTWWKVADMLESDSLDEVEFGLEVVAGSEMPEDVRTQAKQIQHDVAQLRARLALHSKQVLDKMPGVTWPVI